MELHELDGEIYQRWEIQSLNNGYYNIISDISGRAVAVPNGKESTSDIDLILETIVT